MQMIRIDSLQPSREKKMETMRWNLLPTKRSFDAHLSMVELRNGQPAAQEVGPGLWPEGSRSSVGGRQPKRRGRARTGRGRRRPAVELGLEAGDSWRIDNL